MNPLTVSTRTLRKIREVCLALPSATEKEAWGDPTWRVRDKIFAMQKGNYEGGRPALWVKSGRDGQQVLVESRPALFFVPPYVGHKGWVGIHLDGKELPWSVVQELIVDSYRLIAPKGLAALIAPEGAAKPRKRKGP